MPVTINPEVRKPIQGLPEDFDLAHVRGEVMTDPRLIERPGFKSSVAHGVARERQKDLHVQIFDKDNREGIDVRIPAFHGRDRGRFRQRHLRDRRRPDDPPASAGGAPHQRGLPGLPRRDR